MERIKEALEKARQQRDLGGVEFERSAIGQATGSRLGKDRILGREPFRQYSSAEQEKLLECGRVVNIGMGETLQFAGDKNAHVHYLLSGAVVLESKNDAVTVSAGEVDAQQPLDRAGVKAHTIMAASDSEVLRVPFDSLPGRMFLGGTSRIPTEAYTDTYSGEQLASLVEQINIENDALDEAREPSRLFESELSPGADPAQSSLSELAASADNLLAELDVTREDPEVDSLEVGYIPAVDDALGQFTRELEQRFRAYVEKAKEEERAHYEARMQRHAARLHKLATEQIRELLSSQRDKYQAAYAEKEQNLRTRFNDLRDFANKIARQKAAIYAARRQIDEKLRMVDQIHSQLSQLGSQLNNQLDDLDHQMPSEIVGTGSG